MRRLRVIDDSRHALLRKARPVSQVLIDRLDEGPGRHHYGKVEMQEVEVRSALTDFSLGGRVSGVAWSLNPYTGCQHACSYCYVPDTLHAERPRWGSYVIAKRNIATVLAREMGRKPRLTVYLSTATDPYQSVEAEARITRSCLEVLARHDWPIEILTRSPLVTRDIDLLRRFSEVEVGLSVPTVDDRLRAVLEPAAPPIPARLAALRELADAGLTTYANYSPAYPLTAGTTPAQVASAFRQAGVQWVNASTWHYLPSILPVLQNRLRGTPYEAIAPYVADEVWQERVCRAVSHALEREGIPAGRGFFNSPFPPPADEGPRPAHLPVEGGVAARRPLPVLDGGACAMPCA